MTKHNKSKTVKTGMYYLTKKKAAIINKVFWSGLKKNKKPGAELYVPWN